MGVGSPEGVLDGTLLDREGATSRLHPTAAELLYGGTALPQLAKLAAQSGESGAFLNLSVEHYRVSAENPAGFAGGMGGGSHAIGGSGEPGVRGKHSGLNATGVEEITVHGYQVKNINGINYLAAPNGGLLTEPGRDGSYHSLRLDRALEEERFLRPISI